jgi:hypothetical protein
MYSFTEIDTEVESLGTNESVTTLSKCFEEFKKPE